MDTDPWAAGTRNALMPVSPTVIRSSPSSQKMLWSDKPARLPLPPPGHVFPVVAFQMMGEALWAEHYWAGNEMRLADILYRPLLSAEDVFEDDEPSADEITRHLAQYRVARQMVGEAVKSSDEGGSSFSRRQWEKARAAASQAEHIWKQARQRRDLIVDFLSTNAASGALPSVWRSVGGGDAEPIPPGWWQLDHPLPRFRACGLDPNKPMDASASPTAFFFFEGEALAALLRPEQEKAPAAEMPLPEPSASAVFTPLKSPGRKPKPYWEALAMHLAAYAQEEGLPDEPSKLEAVCIRWFNQMNIEEPARSTIGEHLEKYQIARALLKANPTTGDDD